MFKIFASLKQSLYPVPFKALLVCASMTLPLVLSYFYDNWLLSYVCVAAPILIIVNTLVALWLIFKKSAWVLIPLSVIVLEYQFIKGLWVINPRQPAKNAEFSVLSYNVAAFDEARFTKMWHPATMKSDTTVPIRQINYIANIAKADILCFQEFYNNDRYQAESTMDRLMDAGYYYYYTNPWVQPDYPGFFGVATFSKFPIVYAGILIFHDSVSINKGIYTDVVIDDDTVRVINVHMKSMSLRLAELMQSGNPDELHENMRNVLAKMHDGYLKRKEAVQGLMEFIKDSPYPIILSGDLNDIPYSYSYRKLRNLLDNAFEERGNGFGFTYNRFPYIIRIDNQFYSHSLTATDYETDTDNQLSDHYPVKVSYSFNR